jgi:hypothetical protein
MASDTTLMALTNREGRADDSELARDLLESLQLDELTQSAPSVAIFLGDYDPANGLDVVDVMLVDRELGRCLSKPR